MRTTRARQRHRNALPVVRRRAAKHNQPSIPQVDNTSTNTTRISLDFGSGSVRVALGKGKEKPKEICLGYERDPRSGSKVKAYSLPTYVQFGGKERFRLLLFDEPTDWENTSSGIKQSLDDRLCGENSEGLHFRNLCDANGVQIYEVLLALFTYVFPWIEEALPRDGLDQEPWQFIPTIPIMWAKDTLGKSIQLFLAECFVKAGIPDSAIDFQLEHAGEAGDKRGKVGTKVFLDIGNATADITIAEQIGSRDEFLIGEKHESRGVRGGMSDFWRWLYKYCQQRCPNQDLLGALYASARIKIFAWDEHSTDFEISGVRFSADTISTQIDRCFEEAKIVVRKILPKIPRRAQVVISGACVSSNKYIEVFWRRVFSGWDIQIVPGDLATFAVCKHAVTPFPATAECRFWTNAFGFATREPGLARASIQTVKSPRSFHLSKYAEKVFVDDPQGFQIHFFMSLGRQKVLKRKSVDSYKRRRPLSKGMSMESVELDLGGKVCADEAVRIRITSGDSRSRKVVFADDVSTLNIDVLRVNDGGEVLASKTVVIRNDRERILLESPIEEEPFDHTQYLGSVLSIGKNVKPHEEVVPESSDGQAQLGSQEQAGDSLTVSQEAADAQTDTSMEHPVNQATETPSASADDQIRGDFMQVVMK